MFSDNQVYINVKLPYGKEDLVLFYNNETLYEYSIKQENPAFREAAARIVMQFFRQAYEESKPIGG